MLLFPNAKINLGLNVISKREDGYHDLETLFVPVTQYRDILEVVFADEPAMVQYGADYNTKPEDNLCFKAYRLMADNYGISPVAIHLYKNIPVGSGLGGGSADAAFTLRAIDILFRLNLSDGTLAELAAELGSDCPFFIYNKPMFARGKGEILSPYDGLDLSGFSIRIAAPGIPVSTREAYAGITPHKPEIPLEEVLAMPMENWKESLVNDFEESVFAKHPEIASIKSDFYSQGALYASMSGSGSSVYGIFKK